MTKSPHSVTRLRLFELYRLLALLCVFKLCLFGVLLIDVDWGNFHEAVKTVAENGIQLDDDAGVKEETPSEAADADAASEEAGPQALAEATLKAAEAVESSPEREEPQGAEAARLAAEARPAPRPSTISSGLDDSTATAASVASAAQDGAAQVHAEEDSPFVRAPQLAEPPLLEAGLARSARPREEGIMDMLGLSNLPIPRLGSVKAAHAAAQDMPVPSVPERVGNTTFAPAAQQNATVMPGAPAIPPDIPRGEDIASGRAEARRANTGGLPSLPQDSSDIARAPAPTIRPMTLPDDPNEKAQDLARQQQDMLVLRQQMDQRLRELEGAEKRMQELIRDARSLEDQKVRSLIQMYANMKPRVAAKALENMDERVAVRILSGMAPKHSGEILTYTNPEKTAKFTEIITRMRTP